MSDIAVQASFNSGEWAPALTARVDISKYKSGAALLENFFVDYRGGASTRTGSKYVIQAYKSATPVRIITFQATFNIGYALELGDKYMRFIYQGSPILENPINITGATNANPCVLSIPGNIYNIGDWIYVSGIVGMTQIDGAYFQVTAVVGNNVTIADLNGVAINSTAYGVYTSGGTTGRIYTISTPWAAADLALIKFSQSINQMILCHPNYLTQVLSLVTATNWTLLPIVIGTTASAPTGVTITSTLSAGYSTNYSYGVTTLDENGQESSLSTVASLLGHQDIRSVAGSNQITWTPVVGAVAYNVYESEVSYFGVVPIGVEYGFIGTCKATTFVDSNIGADFSQSPPISQNPFAGSGISAVTVTAAGTYTTTPTVSFIGGTPSIPATAIAQLGVIGVPTISSGGAGYVVGDTVRFVDGVILQVTAVTAGAVTAWVVINLGAITSGATPTNPLAQITTSGGGTGAAASAVWGVAQVIVLTQGAGYTAVPTPAFSTGAATATATLSPSSNGNPSLPSFFQQRLVLAAPTGAPQTFYLSKPGAYFNFDVSSPSQPEDSITGTLVSGVLNNIKSIVSTTSGMLLLTDQGSWIVNGGASGTAVTPSAIVANAQSFIGANDVPPIVANYDILYVQSKGSGVRDLSYNIYFNVFTGTDISILSSHLFFGYQITEWAWAQQPFYTVWSVRNDGVMLSLAFLKEQDFVGWAHSVTQGLYKSVCVVTEPTPSAGIVDAVYNIVQRIVNGNTIQYIERMADRNFASGAADAWCVDCGLEYIGSPASTFSGAVQLAGLTVTGVADGNIIAPFVMPVNGVFTLSTPAAKVIVGIGYTCKLQTLGLDMGEPSVQGKVKKINHVDIRVKDTLNLLIGNDFNHLTPMKDLRVGNVSSTLTGQQSQVVTGLVTGDAKTILSPAYTVPGQYCFQQSDPYPASILGVFPSYTIGDDR